MIEPAKLFQLEGGQKRRKLALTFGALERDIRGIAEKGTEYSFTSMTRSQYIVQITKVLLKDEKLDDTDRKELEKLIAQDNLDELRICNVARNALLAIIGTFPAEWDLVIAPHTPAIDENGIVRKRDFFPDVCVYAEDIRSPFNIGSIFRTAEAMGADKVFISPRCIDPTQPRAIRSAMGCIETMGWNRCDLSQLPEDLPVFALETGGTDINDFVFGVRNRGNYSKLNTEGAVITAFNNFVPYGKQSNNFKTFIGINPQGKLIVGDISKFKKGDLLTGTYSNEI